MSNIDLLLDEENELTFELSIEGTRPATAQCRLVLESHDLSLIFESERYDGREVTVVLPPLKHVLKEGEYNMDLEVIVEDKYFKPLSMVGNFEKSLEVVAKPILRAKKRNTGPTASLSEIKVRNKRVAKSPDTSKETLPVTSERNIVENAESPAKKTSTVTDNQILKIIEALTSGKLNE